MTATLQPFHDTMHADSQIKGLHQNDVDPRCFESQCLKWAKLCKLIGLTVKSCLWSRVAVNLYKLDSVLGTSSYLLIVSKLNCAHVCSRTRTLFFLTEEVTATLQPFRDTMHADSQIKSFHQNDVDPRFFEVTPLQ